MVWPHAHQAALLRWGLLVLLTIGVLESQGQGRYMTQTGSVSFFSTSIIEDIEAHTEEVSAIFDLQNGQLAFSIPIKSFQFKRTLMQEHFNENYMETGRFPKATFRGKVQDLNTGALLKGGSQRITVEGDITIHGVTRRITVPGVLELSQGSLLVNAYFSVAPADYNIEIPLLVRENIAKVVGVKVRLTCEQAAQISVK